MSATQFSADLRDIQFVLHEQLGLVPSLSQVEAFAEVDRDLCDTMLEEAYRVCREVLDPINGNGDREGCTLDDAGNVTTPAGFKEAWAVMTEGGWFGISAPEAYGGMGMPAALATAVGEMFTGACMSFAMYPGLTRGAANLLAEFAEPAVSELVCTKMFSGEWSGTMCLTEAGAGSDVGANRAKAEPTDEPGVYALTGEKIFISCGDHDLCENIVHLVLARTPGAPDGTKGLSIFLVPKYAFDAEGNLGERNGAFVEAIEHKMGIHASATCTLILGADQPCKGTLLGKEGQGMPIMFHMMNEARLEVGVQGLSGAAAAYQNALHYARERVQGTAIEDFGKEEASKVTINRHPDVRRMLMWQRVHVEALRALIYRAALRIDQMHHETDKEKRRALKGYVELMTPIIKAYASDRGFDCTVAAMQVYGGYGYIGEYPVEQLARDTKIASIYEGTNGIQAMDLLGRKMRKGSGVLFMNWLAEVTEELEACKKVAGVDALVPAVEKARDSLGASAMFLGGLGMQGNLTGAMLQASPFLDQFGCVALAVETLAQARVAAERLAAGADKGDQTFYRGKLLNARFYVNQVLPRAVALGKSIRSEDESCLDELLFG